jgi:hypothetical protein
MDMTIAIVGHMCGKRGSCQKDKQAGHAIHPGSWHNEYSIWTPIVGESDIDRIGVQNCFAVWTGDQCHKIGRTRPGSHRRLMPVV